MPEMMTADCAHDIAADDAILVSLAGTDMMLCEDCADEVRNCLDSLQNCDSCSNTIATYGDEINADAVSGYRFTYYDAAFSVGSDHFDVYIGDVYNGGSLPLCSSCYDDYSQCGVCCDTFDRTYHGGYCEECDEYYCSDCTSSHDECGAEMSSSVSIADALQREAVPGNVVRSLRAVGCEIERSTGNSRSAAQRLSDAGFLLESHGEHCGHEYVLLPARGANLETAIRQSFEILASENATGNADCGAHFHIDMTDLELPAIYRGLAALRIVESVLFAGTGEADDTRRGVGFRRALNWCRPTDTTWGVDTAEILRLAETSTGTPRYSTLESAVRQNTRYSAINVTAFAEHRTVEIRLMDGVIDAERYLRVIGIALAAFEYGVMSTTGTLRALIGQPLSLLWRASRQGLVSGPAMEWLTDRYGVISAEIRLQEQRERIAAEIRAARTAAQERNRQMRAAAQEAFRTATTYAAEIRDREIAAAREMVAAAQRAYRAAQDAEYRLADLAQAAFSNHPAVSIAAQEQSAALAAADEEYRAATVALQEREYELQRMTAPTATRRAVPSCGVSGCRTCV